MDMDKDLASAIVLERCNCYDSALEAAKKALIKDELPPDQIQATKDVVKSLGALYFKQQCLEKILECYHLLSEISPLDDKLEQEQVEVKISLNKDIFDILKVLESIQENQGKNQEQLFKEAMTLLILNYSTSKEVKNIILEKAKEIF
ncbi:hypothetical protein [Desulfonatronovibrio magnus]|uniref:hypothetical protein n=1 Tax=Desulfonatronovibrio magnus TaxID=698827 RepID=UPI0005EB29CD|nr:hypothetical protein [Desulfonatronovibrio magnus]